MRGIVEREAIALACKKLPEWGTVSRVVARESAASYVGPSRSRARGCPSVARANYAVGNHMLCETNETAQRGIIKRQSLGLRRMHRGHVLRPITVDIIYPDPCGEMWLCRIKKTLHDFFNVR